MKIVINLKDPDGVWDSLNEVGLNSNSIKDTDTDEAINKFISYSEYVSIEIDTETKTARVLKTYD